MALTAGAQLGSYAVLGRLGSGGMGEVFHARDTRLGREVALKMLPEAVARDPERLGRLAHEARVLASLQHPHVATLFAFEEQDGEAFLVMELVPGETLAERIARGPVPLREALALGRQIAEGLEAAHERGIIHLDLKPSNVGITPEGKAKVLDFGVARSARPAASPEMSEWPTRTAPVSPSRGVSGTAVYMSPEQARGQPVDRRADVWAFGATLYEMLSGRRAFDGATTSDVLVRVLEHDPDWSRLPVGTPPSVRQLLARCLRKDPGERLHDAADARILLEDALEAPSSPETRHAGWPRPAWTLGALGLGLAGVLGGLTLRGLGTEPPPVRRFELDVHVESAPSISPDGRRIAFVEGGRLFVRDLDRLETREVPGGEQATLPFWSPDGRAVAFAAAGVLKRAPAEGGPATTICAIRPAGVFAGGAWSPRGEIVVALAPAHGLFEVSSDGGEMRPLLRPDAGRGVFDFHSPRFLPDGRTLLLVVHPESGWRLYAALWDGKDLVRLTPDSYSPIGAVACSGSGRLLFERLMGRWSVYAMPFSVSPGRATGEPALVAEDAGTPSVSDDGTLVYVRGGTARFDLVLVDRTGRQTRLLDSGIGIVRFPRVSPDGHRLLVDVTGEGHIEPWVLDLERGTRVRLARGPTIDVAGAWSSAGDRVLVMSGQFSDSSLAILRADGSGNVETLPLRADALPEGAEVSADWSTDGRYVAFRSAGDLYYGDLRDPRSAVAFTRSPATESEVRFSPDGRYVAYMSDETGRFEVYVRPFPEGEGRWLVSTGGGALPRWSRRGDELFYAEGNALMAVRISTRGGFHAGPPQRLFDGDATGTRLWGFDPLIASYDPMPDGSGFVVARRAAGPPATLVVVESWARELGRR
jgi:serine/threonine protein kinase/Tol biopolymer transport system component